MRLKISIKDVFEFDFERSIGEAQIARASQKQAVSIIKELLSKINIQKAVSIAKTIKNIVEPEPKEDIEFYKRTLKAHQATINDLKKQLETKSKIGFKVEG